MVVAILMVEAGVIAVVAPFPYSCFPVAVSMTDAATLSPSSGTPMSGARVSRSAAASLGASWVVVPSAGRTAGALGAGRGPSGVGRP